MRYKVVIWLSLAVFVIAAAWPFIEWHLDEKHPLGIAVIDKTVPQPDYREHLGLFWVLEHEKITNPASGDLYRIRDDYFGFDPRAGMGDKSLDIPEGTKLIYITDTYGVYAADLRGNAQGVRSSLIYGGLNIFEWNRVMAAKEDDVTLVMEFNSLATPTDALTRSVVERNFNFSWTGWIGRYFSDLQSSEVPVWMRDNYEKQYGEPWDFTGEGIAFVDLSDMIVVFTKEDFNGKVRFVLTEEGRESYPDAIDSLYLYWFDVIVPGSTLVTEAEFVVDWTPEGLDKLRKFGLPERFPAVLNDPGRNMYYFAGDFADIRVRYWSRWRMPLWFFRFMGIILRDESFFWNSYVQMMKEIVKQAGAGGNGR